ncbi:MAG: magnesium transporter [Pirellulales bacterium]|nr:magnesium transporter [Pirellulales bacterium]
MSCDGELRPRDAIRSGGYNPQFLRADPGAHMANPIILPELRLMLAENDDQGLRDVAMELHPATAADFTEGLTVDETWRVLARAPLAQQAEIFGYYDIPKQVEMVLGSGRERMSALLEEMAPDNRVDLLRQLDSQVVEELLPLVAKAERHDMAMLLSYPEHSAGSVMTTEYASLPANITVAEALQRLRTVAPNNEMIYYIYIVDDHRHLLGFISLRDLILAKPAAIVGDIMERELICARVDEDREILAKRLARYDFLAIPVVDDQNHLVGIVTHDDVMDVVVEEATEDVHRMGAVAPLAQSYLDTPFITVWRKRLIWLACLFIAELFTFTALAGFEDEIAKLVVLSLFVPLCISTGGNSGSQAATLITRAVALGEVGPRDWFRVLRHELAIGLVLGLTLGLIGVVRGAATPEVTRSETKVLTRPFEVRSTLPLTQDDKGRWLLPEGSTQIFETELERHANVQLPPDAPAPSSSADDPTHYHFPANCKVSAAPVDRWSLALVVGWSVATICLWGTLVGSMLPLVFRRLGIDPGYASSPFVATFVDVTGIVIYFSIAQYYLDL